MTMRLCPRCITPLSSVEYDGVPLDHCQRCGGTFLDAGEGARLFGAAVSPEVWERSSVTHRLGYSERRCPADGSRLAGYAVEFEEQKVEVDVCEQCAGMWLDAEEGMKLRDIVMEAGQEAGADLVAAADRPGIRSYLFQLFSGLPVEVWNPRRGFPAATVALVGSLFAIFVAEFLAALNGGEQVVRELIGTFGLVPAEVLGGNRVWTLVTSTFLHAGWMHLLGNIYFLYVFGDNVEDLLGRGRFLLLYFAAAVAGSILQAVFQTDAAMPVIGASGAVAGLMGAYLTLFPRVRVYLVLFFIRWRIGVVWYLGFWVGYNTLMAFAGGQGVAWMAHVGGFAAGALIALRYRVRPLVRRLKQRS